jgi:hypothetical protein
MQRENEFLVLDGAYVPSRASIALANLCRMIAIAVLCFTVLHPPFFLPSMQRVSKQRT